MLFDWSDPQFKEDLIPKFTELNTLKCYRDDRTQKNTKIQTFLFIHGHW